MEVKSNNQYSTDVSAWESPCDEKEKRSIWGSLANALLKPCCGSSNAVSNDAPRNRTKAKGIKQRHDPSSSAQPAQSIQVEPSQPGFFKGGDISNKLQANSESSCDSNLLQLQDKLITQRQMMKVKLADKKKAIKVESEKVNRLKKRAKIDKRLEKIWAKVDEQPSNKMKTREQILQGNDAAIEKHNTMIERLKREIDLLKEKQECLLMQYELVRSKGYNSILSETVKQCKATKLRHQYFSLAKEINKLLDEVYSTQHKVQELIPNSSSSVMKPSASPDPPHIRKKSKLPPRKPLPPLCAIEEETNEELEDYENDLDVTPRFKALDFCFELVKIQSVSSRIFYRRDFELTF